LGFTKTSHLHIDLIRIPPDGGSRYNHCKLRPACASKWCGLLNVIGLTVDFPVALWQRVCGFVALGARVGDVRVALGAVWHWVGCATLWAPWQCACWRHLSLALAFYTGRGPRPHCPCSSLSLPLYLCAVALPCVFCAKAFTRHTQIFYSYFVLKSFSE